MLQKKLDIFALMWASQKENTDKRKYVILKYKYVGKKPLEDSNEKRTIRG